MKDEVMEAEAGVPLAFGIDDGPTARAIEELLRGSSLVNCTAVSRRPAMVGNGLVMEVHATRPIWTWSSGELVLWDFITSLAGDGSVNLRKLADHWRDQPQGSQISVAFAVLMGGIG